MSELYPFTSRKVNMPNITPEPAHGKKILDQVSDAIRLKHYTFPRTYRPGARVLQRGGLAVKPPCPDSQSLNYL